MKDRNSNNQSVILYVEGQDQFRGWFNSSLITSVIINNSPPFQQVLSHGFVVDEKGKKMSKSLGNVIDTKEIIQKFGADVLRLWVFSCVFTKEVKVSISILESIQESYQKIRNTLRYLIGNLINLSLGIKNEKELEKNLELIDCYIIYKLEKLTEDNIKNYQKYNFNSTYTSLLNFCINDLSSFYFVVSKDSLYCDSLKSLRRKQIITTFYYLLSNLLKIISPVLPFLAEEIYQNLPFNFGFADQKSIFLVTKKTTFNLSKEITEKIKIIPEFLFFRQDIFQTLEKARQEKIIETNSQAKITIYPKNKNCQNYLELNLIELLIIAELEIKKNRENDMKETSFCFIKIEKTNKKRCSRCWNYRILYDNICERCKTVENNIDW